MKSILIGSVRLKVIAVLLIVFIGGGFVGAGVGGFIVKNRIQKFMNGDNKFVVDLVMHKLNHDLSLNEGQKKIIHELISESCVEIRNVRHDNLLRIGKTVDDGISKIKQVLNDDQCKKLETIHEKIKTKFYMQ